MKVEKGLKVEGTSLRKASRGLQGAALKGQGRLNRASPEGSFKRASKGASRGLQGVFKRTSERA